MIILFQTDATLTGNETYTSNSSNHVPANTIHYKGYTIADHTFTINVYQSFDNTNWDFISTFTAEASNGKYQCGYIVDRIAEYVKFEIVAGATALDTVRGYLAI